MRSSTKPRSLLRAAAWIYVGPFVAIGGLALLALGFGALALFVQLLATLWSHVGR
jgi:hypothetical protein